MNELDKILAVTKGQAAAGTDRIAFDPMALAHAIETGVAAKLAEERERWALRADQVADEIRGLYALGVTEAYQLAQVAEDFADEVRAQQR